MLPTISVLPPHKVGAEVSPARAGFYHMAPRRGAMSSGLGGLFVVEQRFRELERRERLHKLGVGVADVPLGVIPKVLQLLPSEDVAAAAPRVTDESRHRILKTD
jgi:hypothetical protein